MASNYWQQRVLADERRSTQIADHASEELQKMYRTQYLRVVKEIEGLKGDIDYGRPLTRTQLWNYARWRKVEESLRDYVGEATHIGTQVIHEALEREFERVIGDTVFGYGGALGRNGLLALTTLEKNRILSGTWSGEHFSERIWKNSSAIADRMKNEITNMLVDGKSTQDIRRTVMKEFGVSYNNADRLVRTEVSYAHNQLTLERYKANGDTQISILNVEDGNACEVCRELPGKPYDINDAPFLPAHPRCRCCYAPWTYSDQKQWEKEHPEEGGEGTEDIANRPENPNGSTTTLQSPEDDDILEAPDIQAGDNNVRQLNSINQWVAKQIESEFGPLNTKEIVLTDERKGHIQERHPQDYPLFDVYIADIIDHPQTIIRDLKNENTVVLVRKIEGTNLNAFIRLSVADQDPVKDKNSVMTFYRMRESNLEKFKKKNKVIYNEGKS